VDNHTAISLDQGTTTAIITRRNMGAATNGLRDQIQYRVVAAPRGGQLLVEDRPADIFSQANIDREEVVYLQTDMSLANDSFIADITNQDNRLPGLLFNITVRPLVRQEVPFVAAIDNATPITSRHLDATKLAGLTNSNPVYYILTSPRLGRIKRIMRTSRTREPRSVRDREVWHFTQEDLKNGVIYFVGAAGVPLARNTSDELTYRLEAPGVQPALGTFRFLVVQPGSTPPAWQQPLPNVTPTGLVPVHAATRKDIVIASSVVASLLLIIISVILIIKCRRGKHGSVGQQQLLRPNSSNNNNNGHICQISSGGGESSLSSSSGRLGRRNSHFDEPLYSGRSGILPDHHMTPHLLSSPRLTGNQHHLHHLHHHHHLTNNNINNIQLSSPNGNTSDSDSWLESSRSRDTSPSSSIPPSLPAFRVIPLCESESSGTHLSDPPLGGGSLLMAGLGGPYSRHSTDMHAPAGLAAPASEAGSNPIDNVTGGGGERSTPVGQPLLRRNQYWV
jgi:Cadherin-like